MTSQGLTGRTVLVFHSSLMSGPARSFATRLPLTTHPDERWVTFPDHGPAADLFDVDAQVITFRYSPLSLPGRPALLVAAAAGLIRDTWAFARLFRRHRIDTVISATTYTPAAYLAAWMTRTRTVVYCGELLKQTEERRLLKRAVAWLVRQLVALVADLVICCSVKVKAQFPARARTAVVYPSIDVGPHAHATPSERPAEISVVGSITRARGQDTLIEALHLIRREIGNVRLNIAGEPGRDQRDLRFAAELRGLVERLELENAVRFLGHVDDVGSLLACSAVVVNPARFDEPFGRVPYEALAHGRPVVVTATGANTELLTPDLTAVVVPPDSPTELAEGIMRLLRDRALGAEMVRAADEVLQVVRAEVGDARYVNALSGIAGARL